MCPKPLPTYQTGIALVHQAFKLSPLFEPSPRQAAGNALAIAVQVNRADILDVRIESERFGYESGSLTGDQKKGRSAC